MSLDETYDRILLGISRERQEYAQRLLQCLSESIRPLRADELAEILAIRFDSDTLPNYDANWRLENPEEAILFACSGLITIVGMETSRVVQFSHFSVQEYLSSNRLASRKDLSQYHILPRSAHTVLAQASLSVLLALDDQVDKETMKNFPFAIYAARYWVDHAQFDNVCSTRNVRVAMEQLFDSARPHFSAWVWIYDIDQRFREIMFYARPTPPKAVPLYYAALCCFRDLIQHLIIIYPRDVNAWGGFYGTPLHAAVAKGNIDIMILLLEHGADVAAVNGEGYTALQRASERGRLDMISLLLDNHADVNHQTKSGETALLIASFDGEVEVARELLRHGAATDIGSTDGWTPLMAASQNGHLDIVRFFLESGVAVDLQNDTGWTPLMVASQYGHLNVVRLFLESGAAVDLQDNDGQTPLMVASRTGHLTVVHLLLEDGAAVDLQDNNGRTPLITVSENGQPDTVRLLLESGASVELPENDGWTPLLSASRYGQPDVVRLLLQNGAIVDSQNRYGWTPLALASRQGHLDIVQLLLQNGAAVDSSPNGTWSWSPSDGMSLFRSRCCALFYHSPQIQLQKTRNPGILFFRHPSTATSPLPNSLSNTAQMLTYGIKTKKPFYTRLHVMES